MIEAIAISSVQDDSPRMEVSESQTQESKNNADASGHANNSTAPVDGDATQNRDRTSITNASRLMLQSVLQNSLGSAADVFALSDNENNLPTTNARVTSLRI